MFSKRYYILSVGDDGAVLSYICNSRLKSRAFCHTPNSEAVKDFNKIIAQDPKASIYVILDNIDQQYTSHSIPAVNLFTTSKLVKRRLKKELSQADIKGAISVGRTKRGRRDWNYLFASATLTDSIENWVEYAVSQPNYLEGIFLLPLEAEMLVSKFNKKNKDYSNWQLIVTHNRTCGLRVVVLKDGHTIFSRLISIHDQISDVIAGTIDQEVNNTIDYIKRLGYNSDLGYDLTVISSLDTKFSLEKISFDCSNLLLLTPKMAADIAGLEGVLEHDKYCDTLYALSFASSKHLLRLQTKYSKNVYNLSLAQKLANFTLLILSISFILYLLYSSFNIVSVKNSISRYENEKAEIETKWKNAKEYSNYDIDVSNRINEYVSIKNQIDSNQKSPMIIIKKISSILKSNAIIKSFSWKFNYSLKKESNRKRRKQTNFDSSIINLTFLNYQNNIDSLFVSFDNFIKDLRNALPEYKVKNTKIPEKISFDRGNKNIDIIVTIGEK